MVLLLDDGWLIRDCRDSLNLSQSSLLEEGLFGIWTQDKEYWKQILNHIPLVDTEDYYERVINRE